MAAKREYGKQFPERQLGRYTRVGREFEETARLFFAEMWITLQPDSAHLSVTKSRSGANSIWSLCVPMIGDNKSVRKRAGKS
jgi:hypothetical protein